MWLGLGPVDMRQTGAMADFKQHLSGKKGESFSAKNHSVSNGGQ